MPSLLDFTATISLHPSPSISLHSRRLIIPHLDHCNNFLTGLSLSTNFHHLNHTTTTSCPHKARSDHVPLLRSSLLCFIHREQPTFSCNIQGSHSRPLKVSVWLQPSCAFFSPQRISVTIPYISIHFLSLLWPDSWGNAFALHIVPRTWLGLWVAHRGVPLSPGTCKPFEIRDSIATTTSLPAEKLHLGSWAGAKSIELNECC